MKLDTVIVGLVLIAAFYLVFLVGKLVNDLLHREFKLTFELVERDNFALALAMAGYYLGLVLAIGGTLVGPGANIIDDLLDVCFYGLLSIILLNISWYVCDKLILYKFKITDELIRCCVGDQRVGAAKTCHQDRAAIEQRLLAFDGEHMLTGACSPSQCSERAERTRKERHHQSPFAIDR